MSSMKFSRLSGENSSTDSLRPAGGNSQISVFEAMLFHGDQRVRLGLRDVDVGHAGYKFKNLCFGFSFQLNTRLGLRFKPA